ncbi:MAG: hypothetical protein PF693_03410 [Spirochaetia bacterium]|jgi:hypothetical protein|nr:hypothetical protein [Spirochaetia bacterium]
MKKITLSIVLITMASLAVFASGSAEENSVPWSGVRGQYQTDAVISEELTTVTGTINLVEDGHVELIVGNDTYELVYPYRLSYAANLQNGMEITVEEFEAENLRLDNDTETKNLILQSATIDGEKYDLADASNSFGGYGQGNRFTNNATAWGNQQDAPMGQRGRMANRQGGFSQNDSFGRGRK